MSPTETTIIIAAKNEAENLAELLPALRNSGWTDILVVDGHSIDGTGDVCEKYRVPVVRDGGRGKGDALRVGLRSAKSRFVVFMDADGSHEPADLTALLAPLRAGRADLVIASRLLGGSSELHGGFDEFFRLTGSSFITACINHKYRVRLSDSQNGYRAGDREKLLGLDTRENSTTIEQEMLFKALSRGLRVVEVPSHEYPRKHGKSHIRLSRVFLNYIYSLLKNYLFA